ncbi:MAG: hypothetical protein ACRDIY_20390 [Chloroflexota bacterium]
MTTVRSPGDRLPSRLGRRHTCLGLLALLGGCARPTPAGPIARPTLPPIPTPTATVPTVSQPRIAASATASTGTGRRKYGVHLLLDDDGRYPDPVHWSPTVWPEHLAYARELVGEGGYVQQLIRLDDLNVGKWRSFLTLCAREHLIPIVRLASTYDHDRLRWNAPPTDPDGRGYRAVARRYRDFLSQLPWPTATHYVIVGNEPNRGDEWGNQPDPGAYGRFLVDVGAALHEIGATVLAPSLDNYAPNTNGHLVGGFRYLDAETFLDELATANPAALATIDVWSSHAYPLGPFVADPSRQVYQIDGLFGATNPHHQTPPPGLTNRGVNSYRWDLWKAARYLGNRAASLPVMITETGWRHRGSQDPRAKDAANAEVPDDLLATYVDLAFHGNDGRYPDLPTTGWVPWDDDPGVLGAVLFALDGYPRDWGHTNLIDLDPSGAVSGVSAAFQAISKWSV